MTELNNNRGRSRGNENSVSKMIQRYAKSGLRRYRGNLAAVVSAVDQGHVPNAQNVQIQSWTRQLAQTMAESDSPETDSFLLRYELIRHQAYWPSCLFRDASESTTEMLIARIQDNSDLPYLKHLLLAIAWTRSKNALKAFRNWSESPPAWVSHLHIPPKDYLRFAGIAMKEDGSIATLINESCIRMPVAEASAPQAFECRTDAGKTCPACNGKLCWLFDFTQLDSVARSQLLTGDFSAAPLRVLCCLFCGCYEPNFSRFDAEGGAEWLAPLERLECEGSGACEPVKRILSPAKTSPYAACEPFALQDASTIGGMPSWLQDAEYPSCIECGNLMKFLAQHDNGSAGEEGIYYAFYCQDCCISCVHYQQT